MPYTVSRTVCPAFLCLALLGLARPVCSQSQRTQPERRLVVGFMLDAYITDHPKGGMPGSGVSLGYEHDLSRTTSLRAVGSVMSSFTVADDISICYGIPGQCMPNPHFAHRLWGLEALALVRPLARVPVRVMLGPGLLWPVGARVAVRNARSVDTTLGGRRLTLRGGVELTLGRSPNAPLLHLSRAAPTSRILSMTHVWSLGLVLRP